MSQTSPDGMGVFIDDRRNFSIRKNLNLSLFLAIKPLINDYHPERLKHVYIVNAEFLVNVVYKLIAPLMDRKW